MQESFMKAVVGMELMGHYWKPLANWLKKRKGITVVFVNPYVMKQAKELDLTTTARQKRCSDNCEAGKGRKGLTMVAINCHQQEDTGSNTHACEKERKL